jgi:hypothetical protein
MMKFARNRHRVNAFLTRFGRIYLYEDFISVTVLLIKVTVYLIT